MDQHIAAQPDTRFKFAVTGYLGCVADDDLVLKHTIMSQMDIDHQQIAVTNNRVLIRKHAWMHGYIFTDNIVIANLQAANFSTVVKPKNLRWTPNNSAGKNAIIFSHLDILTDDHMCIKYGVVTDHSALIHNGIRSNCYIRADLCARCDHSSWMNRITHNVRIPPVFNSIFIIHNYIMSRHQPT